MTRASRLHHIVSPQKVRRSQAVSRYTKLCEWISGIAQVVVSTGLCRWIRYLKRGECPPIGDTQCWGGKNTTSSSMYICVRMSVPISCWYRMHSSMYLRTYAMSTQQKDIHILEDVLACLGLAMLQLSVCAGKHRLESVQGELRVAACTHHDRQRDCHCVLLLQIQMPQTQ